MKKKIMILVSAILLVCGVQMTALANEGAPFLLPGMGIELEETHYQKIWVGDVFEIRPDKYSYEILEGTENVKLDGSTIEFIKAGNVKIKVTDTEYDFKVSEAQEAYVEYLIPKSIKIGTTIPDNLYIYHNCLSNSFKEGYDMSELTWNAQKQNFMQGINWGGAYGTDLETRTVEGYLPGRATKPGVFPIAAARDEKNPYNVVIEEPVITHNLSDEILVGEELNVTTALENTELADMKVKDVMWSSENRYPIGFQPKVEIVSGAELVERSNGDYTNILSTSETMKFIGEGTVKFKVTYEMLPEESVIPDDDMGYPIALSKEAMYSPEKTFSVKVVTEKTDKPLVLDYTGSSVPTSKELATAIKNADNTEITIKTNQAVALDNNVLKAIKEGSHVINIEVFNKEEKLSYSWKISKISESINGWETQITMGTQIPELEKMLETSVTMDEIQTVSYKHEGNLPGKATVKLYVGDKFEAGQEIYYYYVDGENGKLEIVGETYLVDSQGYVAVEMTHCSDYIFAEKNIVKDIDNENEENNNQSNQNVENTPINVPKTGDTTVALPYVIALIVCAGICTIVLRKRNVQR